ncbi:uncharacterized protein BDV17DRAFT_296616 [Aspergillus undulatus]|uniref:uncharacterized protein n=1 Tax=Aspergillus undulatus TaxID=1810928 RepID=UPI003CCDFE1A
MKPQPRNLSLEVGAVSLGMQLAPSATRFQRQETISNAGRAHRSGIADFHFFDLIIGTSSGKRTVAVLRVLWDYLSPTGGIISLALGVNLWSARKCANEFKALANSSFQKRNFYEESAIESGLEATFSTLNGRPRILLDEPDKELMLWEAARCTSAARFMFPVYQAADGHAYQDRGLNENSPIGLAVEEAQLLWPGNSQVDVALSIGTGWAGERIAKCIDSWENNLDSERLWQEYRQTLDDEKRARYHCVNATLPDALPFMDDTDAIEKMDHATTFFIDGNALRQLQSAAKALLASLFYVSIDCPTTRYTYSRAKFCAVWGGNINSSSWND